VLALSDEGIVILAGICSGSGHWIVFCLGTCMSLSFGFFVNLRSFNMLCRLFCHIMATVFFIIFLYFSVLRIIWGTRMLKMHILNVYHAFILVITSA